MVCVLRRNHPHSPLSKREGSREARSGRPPTNGAAGSGRRRRWNVGRSHRCRSPAPWAGPRGLFRSTPPPHVSGLCAGRRVAGMETPSRAGAAASRTDESPTGWSSRWSRILPGRNQPAVRATASRRSEEYGLPVPGRESGCSRIVQTPDRENFLGPGQVQSMRRSNRERAARCEGAGLEGLPQRHVVTCTGWGAVGVPGRDHVQWRPGNAGGSPRLHGVHRLVQVVRITKPEDVEYEACAPARRHSAGP